MGKVHFLHDSEVWVTSSQDTTELEIKLLKRLLTLTSLLLDYMIRS